MKKQTLGLLALTLLIGSVAIGANRFPELNVSGVITATGGLTGDVTGDLTGNVTGNVTGDVTGNLTGDVTGAVTGDVTGNLTGNVTGDVTGDVTGALTGNADTATALAADPADCAANEFATSIAADGTLTCGTIPSAALPADTFDDVAPTTTKGDLIVHDGTDNVRIAVGNDGEVPIADSSQTAGVRWGTVAGGGGSGSGAYSPIEGDDSNFDSTVGAWLPYKDSAAATPDAVGGMTGGTPTLTCLRTTTGPLRGAGSLEIVHDGSGSLQGEGCAIPFSIDSADGDGNRDWYLRVENVKITGTYALDDVKIFAVDVDNGAVIDPDCAYSERTITCNVGLTNSLNYYMGFHVASANEDAWAIKADDITLTRVAAVDVPMPAEIIGTLKYTGTAGCTWSTTSASLANYAEDTDCATPSVTGSAVAPATKIPGIPFNSLPPGKYEVVTNAILATAAIGANASCSWTLSDGSTNSGLATVAETENVDLAANSVIGVFEYSESQGPTTFQIQATRDSGTDTCNVVASLAGRDLYFFVKFYPDPSTSAVMSTSELMNLPEVETKYLTSNVTTNTTVTDLAFSGLVVGRKYQIGGNLRFMATATASMNPVVTISHNGSSIGTLVSSLSANTEVMTVSPNIEFTAEATTVTVTSTNFSNTSLQGNGTRAQTYLTLKDLGFSVYGAYSDAEICSRYSTNAAQSIEGSVETVIFEDLVDGTSGHYDTTTGVYSVFRNGNLRIESFILWVADTMGSGNGAGLFIRKNGGTDTRIGFFPGPSASASLNAAVNGAITIPVVSGDEIEVRAFHASTAALLSTAGGDLPWVSFCLK